MNELRRHGHSPYQVVVLHGGPGAPGSASSLASGLAPFCGVLEPFQSASDIEGLLSELETILKKSSDPPVTLIGHSWGAWLGFLFAARFSTLVRKLVMVSSGPFEESYVPRIAETRLGRLGAEGQGLFKDLLAGSLEGGKLKRIGALVSKADAFDPLPEESGGKMDPDPIQYERIWTEAAQLRRNGKLLEAGKNIQCPVTAIHGDWDPHPADGVQVPLSKTLKNFKFEILEKCGHKPWRERQAREKFFLTLHQEI